jgi:hypothetical protein
MSRPPVIKGNPGIINSIAKIYEPECSSKKTTEFLKKNDNIYAIEIYIKPATSVENIPTMN